MGAALPIRDELTPEAVRRHARHEANRRTAWRMLAIANVLDAGGRRVAPDQLAARHHDRRRRSSGPQDAGPWPARRPLAAEFAALRVRPAEGVQLRDG